MEREFILYKELQILIQNILRDDNYEQILLRITEMLIQNYEVSDEPEIERYQINILMDSIKESKKQKEQIPILNMILGKLHTVLKK